MIVASCCLRWSRSTSSLFVDEQDTSQVILAKRDDRETFSQHAGKSMAASARDANMRQLKLLTLIVAVLLAELVPPWAGSQKRGDAAGNRGSAWHLAWQADSCGGRMSTPWTLQRCSRG